MPEYLLWLKMMHSSENQISKISRQFWQFDLYLKVKISFLESCGKLNQVRLRIDAPKALLQYVGCLLPA